MIDQMRCAVAQSWLMTRTLRCLVHDGRRMKRRERKCSSFDLRWRICH